MSIDLATEDLIDLRTAAKLSPFRNPKSGRPAHVASLFRYVQVGARAADGSRVRLAVVRTPSGMRTSREAVWRFIAALTTGSGDTAPRTPRQRAREIERAEAELAEAGI